MKRQVRQVKDPMYMVVCGLVDQNEERHHENTKECEVGERLMCLQEQTAFCN